MPGTRGFRKVRSFAEVAHELVDGLLGLGVERFSCGEVHA